MTGLLHSARSLSARSGKLLGMVALIGLLLVPAPSARADFFPGVQRHQPPRHAPQRRPAPRRPAPRRAPVHRRDTHRGDFRIDGPVLPAILSL